MSGALTQFPDGFCALEALEERRVKVTILLG